VERFRQRIGGRTGALDARPEIIGRVRDAWDAGRVERDGADVRVRDLVDRALVFVCRHDVPRGELVVVTLWERDDGPGAPRVPRRFTDALGH
jgi:hypothetical protein